MVTVGDPLQLPGDLVRNGPPSPGDKYRGYLTPHKNVGEKKHLS